MAMFEIEVFFEDQVKECNLLAERASDESDAESIPGHPAAAVVPAAQDRS
jgi:hypothetical protein